MERIVLPADESEVLLAFASGRNIDATAQILNKDPSGVSRLLKRIHQQAPSALEKRGGKWVLTETGRQLNALTQDYIRRQQQICEQRSTLRVGVNREFASRVLGAKLHDLLRSFDGVHLSFVTLEEGSEQALLSGRIDIGIDCGRPFDPGIAFRSMAEESIVIVCSPSFRKKHGPLSHEKLAALPHLLCERLQPQIITKDFTETKSICSFNDIGATRAACCSGLGWAMLPKYAVNHELKSGELVRVGKKKWSHLKYGIWWLRERHTNKKVITQFCDWLGKQNLS